MKIQTIVDIIKAYLKENEEEFEKGVTGRANGDFREECLVPLGKVLESIERWTD